MLLLVYFSTTLLKGFWHPFPCPVLFSDPAALRRPSAHLVLWSQHHHSMPYLTLPYPTTLTLPRLLLYSSVWKIYCTWCVVLHKRPNRPSDRFVKRPHNELQTDPFPIFSVAWQVFTVEALSVWLYGPLHWYCPRLAYRKHSEGLPAFLIVPLPSAVGLKSKCCVPPFP